MRRNWREWFAPPDGEEPSEQQLNDQVRSQSGAGHQAEHSSKWAMPPPATPKCVACQADMSFDDGMYIMISTDWRIHISCFDEVIERHFEDGEVIDLTTGQIHKVDEDVQK